MFYPFASRWENCSCQKKNVKHRWPKSIHSQFEAILHSIRAFGSKKCPFREGIHSIGTWKVYRQELHRFADFLIEEGCLTLLDDRNLENLVSGYLDDLISRQPEISRQTFKVTLAALSKFEAAYNHYIVVHSLDNTPLKLYTILSKYRCAARERLKKSAGKYNRRGYEDPVALIQAIENPNMRLMALLQYEGGLRAEGVGAPSGLLCNPVTLEAMKGTREDPVSSSPVGVICSREKGGKYTDHYVSVDTYLELGRYLERFGQLAVPYHSYLQAINDAARQTGQYLPGRGTHGLKHNFAEERYHQAVVTGMSHEEALQLVSLETSHFRFRETLTYTRGT